MPSADIPYVAVIGGFWQLDEQKAEAAKAAGKIIGAELAKAGFGLVVYFSNEKSLEPYVVSGYLSALTDGAGAIRVRYPESQRGQVKFEGETEIFDHDVFPGQDWETPFYRSLAEKDGVDAVLLVAGGDSTLIAGQVAVARQLPILAVDQFDGAAGKIWNQLAQASHDRKFRAWGTRPPEALVRQLRTETDAAAARRKEARRREQVIETIFGQRHKTRYLIGAGVALLVTFFFALVYMPFPSAYTIVMLAGLIAAGATGAMVRLVFWGPQENDPIVSLALGSIAGFVVGLAYLVPQWIGAPGVLAGKADTVITATDKIQFVSAALVALSAGVGFDTVFNRLQEQARGVPIAPPKQP